MSKMTQTEPAIPKFSSSMELTLPASGEVVKIEKLKAGKYYEAQKVYVEWLQQIRELIDESSGKIDPKKFTDEKGKVDTVAMEKEVDAQGGHVNIAVMLSKAEGSAKKQVQLLAICLGKSEEEILNNYFPEDMKFLVDKAITLNNFIENLRKSVAPSVG
jgi:hypothetical protein